MEWCQVRSRTSFAGFGAGIAYDGINGGHQVGASPDVAHDFMKAVYAAKEECFVYVYISNENANLIDVYFDDVVMTHKRSRLIQGNEYYPFGMQTANSWTRESVTGNNYLANGGTELNATTQLYDLEFRNYDPALGRMFQVDPVAAKYASLTPYNYSFNNPIAFADPSGADPDPEYQNPNHQYYFHNGAGSAGYPGLTYDDVVPQSARGEFNSAFGWRQDTMLGWFSGSGPSLNSGAFASQSFRYMLGLAKSMANLVDAALSRGDGVTLMTFSGGHLTSSDYKSTGVFFREVGRDLAKEYYGGDGRMPEGYMPPSYNLFPSVGQVVGMLPILFGELKPGWIYRSIYEEYESDFSDGTKVAGFALRLRYIPSEEQLAHYSSYNMIAIVGAGVGKHERIITSDMSNEGPLFYDFNYPYPDGDFHLKYDLFMGSYQEKFAIESSTTYSLQILFLGFKDGVTTTLGSATFGFAHDAGKTTFHKPIIETW